jgi:hypothetical protein
MVSYDIVMYTALYAYDCLVTIGQEVNSIWARKWTLTTWIYVVNRYVSLFSIFFNFVEPTDYKVRNCVIRISYIGCSLLYVQFHHSQRLKSLIIVISGSLTQY